METETWLTVKETAELLELTDRAVRKKIESRQVEVKTDKSERGGRAGVRYLIALSSLPPEAQQKYFEQTNLAGQEIPDISEAEVDAIIYSNSPPWAQQKADKYMAILQASAGLKGRALKDFIQSWNKKHPEFKTSYQRVIDARKNYEQQGISGLLAQYGKNRGNSRVKDQWFDYFKAAYLKEGEPSLYSCWLCTLGFARIKEPSLCPENFPSPASFLHRLKQEVPESAIYMARRGRAAWNKKYGYYIDRDYNSITAGECWVSDHAQLDIAVKMPGGRTKYVFAWITAWRDLKTSKWLGWFLHAEPPNSDHIFQAFYRAAKKYGVPKYILIDNGKDYRSRDFAGGRKTIKVKVDEVKTTSMVGLLKITPIFAIPYNAQAKPIERDFLRNKEWFSKHMPGYRGGNVTERPEKLKTEIKTNLIMELDEASALLDKFINEVADRMPRSGKLGGKSPNQAWHEEVREINKVTSDALKLFCMRTSKTYTIGRNGIRDSELQVTYWNEWMHPLTGTKVYLRRDPERYQEAWVFTEKDEYLGRAVLAEQVAAIAKSDVEKQQLKEALARKRRAEKVAKSYFKNLDTPSPSEIVTHMSAGVKAVNELRGYEPQERPEPVARVANTDMDKVIIKDRQMQRTGTEDLSSLVGSLYVPQRKIILFESDKD